MSLLEKIKHLCVSKDVSPDVVRKATNDVKYGQNIKRSTDNFKEIVDNLGYKGMRFHDLRHYYASILMSMNIPDKYVMERVGHSTDTMLKTVYQHTLKEKQKEIDKNVMTFFETL